MDRRQVFLRDVGGAVDVEGGQTRQRGVYKAAEIASDALSSCFPATIISIHILSKCSLLPPPLFRKALSPLPPRRGSAFSTSLWLDSSASHDSSCRRPPALLFTPRRRRRVNPALLPPHPGAAARPRFRRARSRFQGVESSVVSSILLSWKSVRVSPRLRPVAGASPHSRGRRPLLLFITQRAPPALLSRDPMCLGFDQRPLAEVLMLGRGGDRCVSCSWLSALLSRRGDSSSLRL